MSKPNHQSRWNKRNYSTCEVRTCCQRCGWSFTVHRVPLTPVYKKADWFCPHCGRGTGSEVANG